MQNLADLDMNKLYTYADYFKWQFEERVELIKGRIFKMSPAPNYFHQSIAGELYGLLREYLKGHPCKAMIAPFDVRLPRKSKEDKDIVTVLQPDVCVVCDPSKFDYRGCIGAPDIVVEILSPGNNAKELRNKFEVYEEAGVKEYWVISPQDNTFLMNTLVDGRYVTSRQMAAGDIVTTTVLPGFTIDLKELFDAAKI
jgi:Uma2 family endonuclease